MNRHRPGPGAEARDLGIERCATVLLGEKLTEYKPGMHIRDHRAPRPEHVTSGKAHAGCPPARVLEPPHGPAEMNLASQSFQVGDQRIDHGFCSALADRHAEALLRHRLEVGEQGAQRRERGLSIAVWAQNGFAVVLGFIAGVWNFCRGLSGMSLVGKVESLWRYPVKSMRGEELQEAFFAFSGVYGDRLFAFKSSAAPKGFPYLTGREQEEMLLYRPRFRYPERAARPPNLSEAESMPPGINPNFADAMDLSVDVETPTGEVLEVDDPNLMSVLSKRMEDGHVLTLLRSERALTDCRPISLFAIQTGHQLGAEIGRVIDKARLS